MNFWNILGIPPQADLEAIRAAYAEKARACHPEEAPEEFETLHEAYRAAMAQARQWRSRPAEAAPEPDLPAPAEEQSSAPETEEDLFAGTEFAHDAIRPEDISAKYEDGILRLSVPKTVRRELPEASAITIL